MGTLNQQFWHYWKKGMFDEALTCAAEEEKPQHNRLQTMLFGTPEQLKQTGLVTGISAGEFLYDVIMINPAVVDGLDFARTEDLSSLFTLSRFASHIDTTTVSGDVAQLQGYVAEQMVAAELQAKGHEVEFPSTSNNPGWDILVDGQPFQVKCMSDPAGVREHLDSYPDIPVYINEELAPYFEGNPNVYVTGVSREEVLEATTSTLEHADDLLDFEIPWITAGVSSFYNIKRMWKDDVSINQAVFHVVSDTTSKVILGSLGQKAGILVGTLLFGPAGGITGAMFGAYAGASQGGKLSSGIKRVFSKKQEKEMIEAAVRLFSIIRVQLDRKMDIKQRKMTVLREKLNITGANQSILHEAERNFRKETGYLLNKKEELSGLAAAVQNGSKFVLDILPSAMSVIAKTGVHPFHYQEELRLLQHATKEYMKKV